jgi:KAP family P-loop domain
VADAIVDLIRTETGGKSIGLEGTYGSGKTTVVNLIRTELLIDENYVLIPFDAWAHEGDPLRRTFLETLIRGINEKTWIDEDKWKKQLDLIAQRREEKTTKTVPQLKPIAKVIGVSLFLIPFGISFLNAAARELETIDRNRPVSWKFVIGT